MSWEYHHIVKRLDGDGVKHLYTSSEADCKIYIDYNDEYGDLEIWTDTQWRAHCSHNEEGQMPTKTTKKTDTSKMSDTRRKSLKPETELKRQLEFHRLTAGYYEAKIDDDHSYFIDYHEPDEGGDGHYYYVISIDHVQKVTDERYIANAKTAAQAHFESEA